MNAVIAVAKAEFRRIFTLAPVFAVLVVASILYAAFYPQPYLNEALRDVPIAVVDHDRTNASRAFIRAVDASQDVAVVARYPDMPQAERAVFAREAYGVLHIPQYFQRDLLHGRQAPVAVFSDASYFMFHQRVAGAVGATAAATGARIETDRLVMAGVDPLIAKAAADPMPLTAVPLFNPEGGYASYIVPAAFVLILQQVLLIGVGVLNTIPAERAPRGTTTVGPVTVVAGKLCAYLVFEAVLIPLYLVIMPYIYGLPRLGGLGEILLFAVPFVLAVAGMGLALCALLRTPIIFQLSTAALGLPLFFLAGYAWPIEALPEPLRLLAALIPSSPGIAGFIAIAQLDAPFAEIRDAFLHLWALAGCFVGLAILLARSGAAPWAPDQGAPPHSR